jgi:hypothetical protein
MTKPEAMSNAGITKKHPQASFLNAGNLSLNRQDGGGNHPRAFSALLGMQPTSSQLVFNPTPEAFAIGVAFVVAVAGLAFMAWRRSGWRPLIGWLELLRVIIAVCIAITLLQPEWLETFKPQTTARFGRAGGCFGLDEHEGCDSRSGSHRA